MKNKVKNFSLSRREELLKILKERFEKIINRHQDFSWDKIQEKLRSCICITIN